MFGCSGERGAGVRRRHPAAAPATTLHLVARERLDLPSATPTPTRRRPSGRRAMPVRPFMLLLPVCGVASALANVGGQPPPPAAVADLPHIRSFRHADAVVPRRSDGSAPGLYASYDWPKPAGTSPDMEVDHTWVTIPPGSSTDGNGVFASSQYWYESYGNPCPNRSDHGMSCNSAGYMGSQVMRGGKGGAERHVFIFSCWDADTAHKVAWTTPLSADKSWGCSRFGGEGTGSHCMLEVPPKAGATYNFKVGLSGHNATGAMWSGVVTEKGTGKQTAVGTLFYPHLPGRVGFGNLKVQSDDFLEYFLGGTCNGAVTTSVGITGPFFNGRTVSASQAYPSYGSGGCTRSDVSACIPGVGCGKPHVLLRGGVARNTSDKTPLW
jgi:hypothetical protein